MPTYDYRCPTNNRVVEVRHRISEQLSSWGELCEQAGLEVGDTPPDSPVEKLATGGQVVRSGSLGDNNRPCQMGARCGGGSCPLN
ncbi:zinc ribbon domain-containing protein [Marinobacterium arenosum]|uniref:zinc ribbon domain-containing protein n=1 Tax=Marinobacterium arenosum TaxID=2862496 RepID=UPI001C96D3D2|nr:zinc ribbon domain-containing protein [Marinobacterium arenosum]MBY4676142.1 zinc ribbon domain-containing protein [Marinobacterium arenosum]